MLETLSWLLCPFFCPIHSHQPSQHWVFLVNGSFLLLVNIATLCCNNQIIVKYEPLLRFISLLLSIFIFGWWGFHIVTRGVRLKSFHLVCASSGNTHCLFSVPGKERTWRILHGPFITSAQK